MKSLILYSIIALSSVSVWGQKTLTFSAYPAHIEPATARQINVASHPKAKTFRTNLKESLASGVNFAGHFILATWGCGTGCGQCALIDGKTGNVFFPPQLAGTTLGYGELSEKAEMLEHKKDSTLLILYGVPAGSKKYGIWYYEWMGKALKLIKFVAKKGSALSS